MGLQGPAGEQGPEGPQGPPGEAGGVEGDLRLGEVVPGVTVVTREGAIDIPDGNPNGITAVTREADERRNASSRINSSTRFSLTGIVIGCRRNTSRPRTFSSIWQKISPSEKFCAWSCPSSMPR